MNKAVRLALRTARDAFAKGGKSDQWGKWVNGVWVAAPGGPPARLPLQEPLKAPQLQYANLMPPGGGTFQMAQAPMGIPSPYGYGAPGAPTPAPDWGLPPGPWGAPPQAPAAPGGAAAGSMVTPSGGPFGQDTWTYSPYEAIPLQDPDYFKPKPVAAATEEEEPKEPGEPWTGGESGQGVVGDPSADEAASAAAASGMSPAGMGTDAGVGGMGMGTAASGGPGGGEEARRGGRILQDEYPTHYMPGVGRQVMAGGGTTRQEGEGYGDQTTGTSGQAGAQAGRLPFGGVIPGGEGVLPASDQAHLEGLPTRIKVPMTGETIEAGHNPHIRRVAQEYMKGLGQPYVAPRKYVRVDPTRAQRIAQEYERMEHNPEHALTKAAYGAMIDETMAQYRAAQAAGLKVEFWDPETQPDPYGASPRFAVEDVNKNNHMFVFPTHFGFGSEPISEEAIRDNPLLADSGERWNGYKVTVNDIFRAVHDYFGHAKEGVGFRHDGEENAWRSHAGMYSPLARLALTSETRGQNSWLNFGPHGAANKNSRTEDTVFADQKAGLMPPWTAHEGAEDFLPADHRAMIEELHNRYGRRRGGSVPRMAEGGMPDDPMVAKALSVAGAQKADPMQSVWDVENKPTAIISPKPGEKYGQIIPKEDNTARIEAVARAALPILTHPRLKKFVKDAWGIPDYDVTPTHGTWNTDPEPSFAFHGKDLTSKHAKILSNLFGFGMWQDAAVHMTHNRDEKHGTPSVLIGHGGELNSAEISRIMDAAKEQGLDLSITKDKKAAKFSHFGEDAELPQFAASTQKIAAASGMPHVLSVRSKGSLINAKQYLNGILGARGGGTRDQARPERSPDLFRGIVDNILAPYTKAASDQGYRFSAEKFADHHALSEEERDILVRALNPTRAMPGGHGRSTVKEPVGYEFPGIYGNPKLMAAVAASRVAPESPALKRVFGVTRAELYEMGANRVGNMEPRINMNPNATGSAATRKLITPENEKRIIDILTEAGRHEALRHGMDAWYVMDPVYQAMERLLGPHEARARYTKMNNMVSMASPGSPVVTEINRGLGAYYLDEQGRFDDFVRYGAAPGHQRGRDFPADLAPLMGHVYHKTSQAGPMAEYLRTGTMEGMTSPKVPLYAQASQVPQTGFQTKLAVPDAHWTRAIGLADARRGVDPTPSMRMSEYQVAGPWFRDKIAHEMGLESVPAQARLWGAGSGATGVDTAIGSPKIEMLANHIMEVADRHGISPEKARDLVLMGKIYKRGGEVRDPTAVLRALSIARAVTKGA